MTLTIRRKITLGVIIGSRAFFSPAPCLAARTEVLAQLSGLGINVVTLPFEATENGTCGESIAERPALRRTLQDPPR